jgi:hypothetical protein
MGSLSHSFIVINKSLIEMAANASRNSSGFTGPFFMRLRFNDFTSFGMMDVFSMTLKVSNLGA